MISLLTPGWYYKLYGTPLAQAPVGPFRTQGEAIAAAAAADPDVQGFALLRVIFDNFAWGP